MPALGLPSSFLEDTGSVTARFLMEVGLEYVSGVAGWMYPGFPGPGGDLFRSGVGGRAGIGLSSYLLRLVAVPEVLLFVTTTC